MSVLKWQTLRMISENIIDAESQVDRERVSLERVLRRGAGVPGGKKERVMFGERNPLREEGTNSFAITLFVRSFERPKGKTLLIASRIDSSKVGRGQSRSLLPSPVRSLLRSIRCGFCETTHAAFQRISECRRRRSSRRRRRRARSLRISRAKRSMAQKRHKPSSLPCYACHDIHRFRFDPAPQLSAILSRDHKSSRIYR